MNFLIIISVLILMFQLVLSHDTCDIRDIFMIQSNVCAISNTEFDEPLYILYSVSLLLNLDIFNLFIVILGKSSRRI